LSTNLSLCSSNAKIAIIIAIIIAFFAYGSFLTHAVLGGGRHKYLVKDNSSIHTFFRGCLGPRHRKIHKILETYLQVCRRYDHSNSPMGQK